MSANKTEDTMTKWQVKTKDGEYVVIEGHEHNLDTHGRLIFFKDNKVVAGFVDFMYFKEM